MYKQLKLSVLKELEESGDITFTVRRGWESTNSMITIPHHICYQIGASVERIFNCYISVYGNAMEVSDIEPGPSISNHKNLVDAYLGLAIQGAIDYAKSLGKTRLLIDSYIPSTAEHLVDKGFKLTLLATFSSVRGALARGTLKIC